MSTTPEGRDSWGATRWVELGWVAAAFLWVALVLDPTARYVASAPIFFARWETFRQHLGQSGGLAEYVAGFLAQADQGLWLGAAVATGCVVLVAWLTAGVVGRSRVRMGWDGVWPAAFLVMLYGRYAAPVAWLATGVIVSTAAVLGWMAMRREAWGGRLVLGGLWAVAVGYAAGPLACLHFVVTCAVLEGVGQGLGRGALAGGLGLGIWAAWVTTLSLPRWTTLVGRWGGWPTMVLVALVYAALPAVLVVGGLARRWRRRGGETGQGEAMVRRQKAKAHRGAAEATGAAKMRWAYGVVGLGLGLAAGGGASLDGTRRDEWRVQVAAEKGDWEGVVAGGRRLGRLPAAARLQMHRALFHLGRLNSELFTVPQVEGGEMLGSLADGLEVCLPLCDTFLELGHINMAEHYAQEALESRGERPVYLWRMAVINVLKERPKAARVFLNRLAWVPFHAERARRWLAALDRDPSMAEEEEVVRVRKHAVASDWVERRYATERLLRQSVDANPTNRMAAEYLVAQWLLTRQTDEVVRRLDLAAPTPEVALPRHVAEAVVAATRGRGAKTAVAGGRAVGPELEAAFERFVGAVKGGRGEGRANGVDPVVVAKYGDSYWFFEVFGRSAAAAKAGGEPARDGSVPAMR